MIDKSFVSEVVSVSRKPQVVRVHERDHLALPDAEGNWSLSNVAAPAILPDPVDLTTLDGIIGYVRDNRDGLALTSLSVIAGDHLVEVVGPAMGAFAQRATYARAELVETQGFPFGTFIDLEAFIISLMTRFVETMQLASVIKVVGNIKEENVRQTSDDGHTQTVTARSGAVMAQEVEVPNPVALRPYRTFREVAQPESLFVLRLRSGKEGQKPSCALFDADGGSWRLQAIQNVAAYLREKLQGTAVAVLA